MDISLWHWRTTCSRVSPLDAHRSLLPSVTVSKGRRERLVVIVDGLLLIELGCVKPTPIITVLREDLVVIMPQGRVGHRRDDSITELASHAMLAILLVVMT
jgi:hypothetical protein